MQQKELDIVIVGAGFSGLYMLHCAHQLGLQAIVLEAGDGVGGTWYWNRYPGARCDVPSLEYSFQFDEDLQQDWEWSERYAPQSEILSYLEHVVERFDLLKDIEFNCRVSSASFDEDKAGWLIETESGASFASRYCVFASGCLSSANKPSFDNEEAFKGPVYHTGNWPREDIDFTGLDVAVIGTGSSGIQCIPEIAKQAKKLIVFQRTPGFSVPAFNRPLDSAEQDDIKLNYRELRQRAALQFSGNDFDSNPRMASEMTAEEIQQELDKRWEMGGLNWYGAFADLLIDESTNKLAADYVRGKIKERVGDADIAETLLPQTHIGCKRLCVDTDYFETYKLEHVSLVDISESGIDKFTRDGLMAAGEEYKADVIVFATGFDAMTGALNKIDIRGRLGISLQDKWEAGPRTYLGLQTSGFPNLFIITGPGSPSVLTNMVPSIEQNVEFVRDALSYMRDRQFSLIEATKEAEDAWVSHNNEVAASSLLPHCNSWYLGANIPGKPRVFMPYLGFPDYVEKCTEVAAGGYLGFNLQK